ncbi:MAG: phosphoribosyl-AMP cyclohydrolase [Pseudomonadota bacterium]|jgi:phosphoribosyl-AMP cyclohydrolase|nr:phosphoribosyl-AMP cyclohydrolase [Pseudomonadota bacterium]HJO35540.1 phosphoribosyl-AMP cyclohydrolase [Gammaproteobacteria bacterium]
MNELIDAVHWNADGLVAAIAQDVETGRVLMLAWMNREALELTLSGDQAVYYSRSRGRLWRKGEQSGHTQHLHEIRLDCDGDAIVLLVTQRGGIACHTGRQSCFYRRAEDGAWRVAEPVRRDPAAIYGTH